MKTIERYIQGRVLELLKMPNRSRDVICDELGLSKSVPALDEKLESAYERVGNGCVSAKPQDYLLSGLDGMCK